MGFKKKKKKGAKKIKGKKWVNENPKGNIRQGATGSKKKKKEKKG